MKKGIALLVAALIMLPGCGGCGICCKKKKEVPEKEVTKKKKKKITKEKKAKPKKKAKKKKAKKKKAKKKKSNKKVAFQEVDIPLVDEEFQSWFDGDIGEFADADKEEITEEIMISELEEALAAEFADDYFWVEDKVDEEGVPFKTVFFDFDKYNVRDDQEEYVKTNIEIAKSMLEEGEKPVIVIEGNSCNSHGSREYNLVLSNNRADHVAQRFIAEGFPRENIKVVGRGVDNPVIDEEGNPVTGDKDAQWANRRVEVKIYS